jgi:hypothetical protein
LLGPFSFLQNPFKGFCKEKMISYVVTHYHITSYILNYYTCVCVCVVVTILFFFSFSILQATLSILVGAFSSRALNLKVYFDTIRSLLTLIGLVWPQGEKSVYLV